jgi:hypothetical protein
MRRLTVTLTGISLAAALVAATPASATSTVAVDGPCTDLTDGIAVGC